MITFLNFIVVVAGSLMLLMVAALFVLLVLMTIAEWRNVYADADAERGDQRIVRGAVANSMGKP